MKKSNMVSIALGTVALALCILITLLNLVFVESSNYRYKIDNLEPDHDYVYNDGYLIPSTLYGFKSIAVDDNGVIYVGHDYGIAVYNEDQEFLGEFVYEFSDFAFMFENDFELTIISGDSRLIKGEQQKDNTTYLVKYNVAKIEGNDNLQADIIESKTVAQDYNTYKSNNGFTESNICKTGNMRYKYYFYGRLKIDDHITGDGTAKYVSLPASVLPVPISWTIIIDGLVLSAFIVLIILGMLSSFKSRPPKQ